MFEKLAIKLLKKVYPERNFKLEKIGKKYFICMKDNVGVTDWVLEGWYSYEATEKLNEIIGGHAWYGYSTEIGPIAFIGCGSSAVKDGYFYQYVHEYGVAKDETQLKFKVFTLDEAKQIGNYTVYGNMRDESAFKQILKYAKISKISYIYDARMDVKKEQAQGGIMAMDCKIKGTFDYESANMLATGTKEEAKWVSGSMNPIYFAEVDDNRHVGIINMNSVSINISNPTGFIDVWLYGEKNPPEVQKIRMLSSEEARTITDYELYIFDYSSLMDIEVKKYDIEKRDRTLDSRFKFSGEPKTDIRLKF